ncbi:unnamed protein product [Paramecium primaurelia]|uniref:Uncharacterized protein n=1 Tax=Paramecium primaurelia TaxID=5886 RepID=A0A8S1KZN4_PARPR|nr:unnamed protein product [Paramecium primaurelia]
MNMNLKVMKKNQKHQKIHYGEMNMKWRNLQIQFIFYAWNCFRVDTKRNQQKNKISVFAIDIIIRNNNRVNLKKFRLYRRKCKYIIKNASSSDFICFCSSIAF